MFSALLRLYVLYLVRTKVGHTQDRVSTELTHGYCTSSIDPALAIVFFSRYYYTSRVPVQSGPIEWPPVLLLVVISNNTLNTALHWVLGNTLAKCEGDQMISCREHRLRTT